MGFKTEIISKESSDGTKYAVRITRRLYSERTRFLCFGAYHEELGDKVNYGMYDKNGFPAIASSVDALWGTEEDARKLKSLLTNIPDAKAMSLY